MKLIILFILVVGTIIASEATKATNTQPQPKKSETMNSITSLIPQPKSIIQAEGELIITPQSSISYQGPSAKEVAELLAEYLRPSTGFLLPTKEGQSGTIHLEAKEAGKSDSAGFVEEDYKLRIANKKVILKATNATGLARGIQTLRQLFPSAIFADKVQKTDWVLPVLNISDQPRFRWRGQLLDVSRHFFSVKEVCKFIDLLALHRLNVCHLHLSDDQGWRVEIKKYPKLTKVGSIREETLIGHERNRPRKYDGKPYGGFYTQEDIKTIVEFAKKRHISILPEIDMPGHMGAAIRAYPELGNSAAADRVRCHWGISQKILNLDDSTITFTKDVLDEIMTLFPNKFIHIGGDEAPKVEWNESKSIQLKMAELGLKSEDELQAWFIEQMTKHIESKGRKLVGWDEIIEGGLAAGTTVMSWRGEKGGIHAAQKGHDVVMAPNQSVYFDHYQASPTTKEPLAIGGMTTVKDVYEYEPIPAQLPKDKHHHILGAQGQLWTEYIPNMPQAEYMGFPRICALSEVLWLEPKQKNYNNFLERLKIHRQRLDKLDVNAHKKP